MSPKNNRPDNDLIGFKDFLEGEKAPSHVNKNTKNTRNDGFELLTFLEQDSIRLQKLIKIFEEKSFVLRNYSQAPALCQKLEVQRNELKQQLVEKFSYDQSHLMTNLAEIFRQHFS